MKDIIQQYLAALQTSDTEKMSLLFADDAIIHSPLYGDVQAKDFFSRLFADTGRSFITLINMFTSLDKEGLCSAHFRYDWMLKTGVATNFECIDIFQFDERNKIEELTIIYDTYKIRAAFEELT